MYQPEQSGVFGSESFPLSLLWDRPACSMGAACSAAEDPKREKKLRAEIRRLESELGACMEELKNAKKRNRDGGVSPSSSVLSGETTDAVLESAAHWEIPTLDGRRNSNVTDEERRKRREKRRQRRQKVANLDSEDKQALKEAITRVEDHVAAVKKFKNNEKEKLLQSRSRLQRRLSKRMSTASPRAAVDRETPPSARARKQIVDVVFLEKTLGLQFEEMENEPPYTMFVWSVVAGRAAASKGILADDVLIGIGDKDTAGMSFDDCMDLLLKSSRPITLRFMREFNPESGTMPG